MLRPNKHLNTCYLLCERISVVVGVQRSSCSKSFSWRIREVLNTIIFHCDAKPFALGTFASPNAKNINMLVFLALSAAN